MPKKFHFLVYKSFTGIDVSNCSHFTGILSALNSYLPVSRVFVGSSVFCSYNVKWPSQAALVVKNLPANVGDATDASSIPKSGRSLEACMATHSHILAWRIPWTEEPGLSMGPQSWT